MRTPVTGTRDGEWPAAPEPLPVPVIDSHTHIDLQEVLVSDALEAAAAAGVARVVQVGVDVPSSQWGERVVAEWRAANPGVSPAILATVALHPNEAPMLGTGLAAALAQIEQLASLDTVHGLGETGLDYFRTPEEGRAAQQESFRAHIDIAKRYDKTLIIHDREAHDDVLRILNEQGAPDRVVMHCFSGDAELARKCADAGYYMSFAGNITFKNAHILREAAKTAPSELLLVETDGPFLTPEPFRGRPNGPYLTPLTVRFLAELRDEKLDELCATIWANGEQAFAVK